MEQDQIDIRSNTFAERLASLLVEQRRRSGRSRRSLAKASGGTFTAAHLKDLERGRLILTETIAGDVALLYGADLGSILPARLPLEIQPFGVISTGGAATSFTPGDRSSLLTSYLRLIRQLRGEHRPPAIVLRRSDIEVLAAFLDEPAEDVIDHLGGLMGATKVQRRAMAGMFVAGATVIGLAGSAAASIDEGVPKPATPVTTVVAPENAPG